MEKTRFIFCAGALLIGGSSAAWGQTRDLGAGGELLDGVAAIVDEGVVLKSELERQVAVIIERLRQQDTQLPPLSVLESQILDQLVLRRIQLQRAERFGIQVSDDFLNQTLSRVAQENNLTLEQLPRALEADGIDYAAYRQDMREQMVLQQLQQRDVVSRINVAPKEMDACLYRKANTATDDVDYNISHILISLPSAATRRQLDEARDRITQINDRLAGGEDFAQLAVAFSDGQTALEGGSLGWRKGSQLPTLFADVVVELEPGEVSETIQSGSGLHLVRLNEVRGAEKVMVDQRRVRHILLRPNEILDSDAVRQKLIGIREQVLGGESFSDVARAVSEDQVSAAEGGDLGWAGPDTFAPEFEQVINNLALDELSEPFRTRFGWHIAEITDTRVYDTTEELKTQQCFEEIRASKLEEETELWLRRIRDEAYVETRM
jgi:peptidyl-prolyl cis-trans isomerase SurA